MSGQRNGDRQEAIRWLKENISGAQAHGRNIFTKLRQSAEGEHLARIFRAYQDWVRKNEVRGYTPEIIRARVVALNEYKMAVADTPFSPQSKFHWEVVLDLFEWVRGHLQRDWSRIEEKSPVNSGREEKVRDKRGKERIRRGTKYPAATITVEEPPGILPFVNTLIVGDAEEVLKDLPADSVDMVITSPPYNFGHAYAGDQTEDTREGNEYFAKLYRIWEECYRILKPGGRIAVNVQPLFSDYVPTHHIISHQLLQIGFLWEKSNDNAKFTAWGSWQSPSMPYIKYTWEFIEVFDKLTHRKGGVREAIDITADEFKEWVYGRWVIAPESRMKEFGHPAMFPEEIPYHLMRLFTYRGDIVVDPFNGAGTTTVVAYRLRRRFIGIDISPEYCQIAYERVCREAAQKPLLEYGEEGKVLPPTPYPDPRLLTWEYPQDGN